MSVVLSVQTVTSLRAGKIVNIMRRVERQGSRSPEGWKSRYRFVPLFSVKIVAGRRAGQMLADFRIIFLCGVLI